MRLNIKYVLKCVTAICLLYSMTMTCAFAQTNKINLRFTNTDLSIVLESVKEQSGKSIFYNNEGIDLSKKVTINIANHNLEDALNKLLKPLNLKYEIVEQTIVISPAVQQRTAPRQQVQQELVVSGRVLDAKGNPLDAVSVIDKNNPSRGVLTDNEGKFSLKLASANTSLIFSYIGMVTQTINLEGRNMLEVIMAEDNLNLEAVIVNGYMSKARNSFTGTAVKVRGDELISSSPSNIMDAIKVFDPSLNFSTERDILGSNPNSIPESIQIRGGSGMPDISQGNLQTYTNLPIFIMDGFQVTVQQVFDLDINRVESITILKDAAAASIYGSRAANGVMVIETKQPQSGKLRVNYTLNSSFQTPDLSSYNLMNSAELLEYMRLSGKLVDLDRFDDEITSNVLQKAYLYNILKSEVDSGVDTYWLSQPLVTALQHNHSLMLEGGFSIKEMTKWGVRYQVNLMAAPEDGVMKGSSRNRYNAGLKFLFNAGSKLQISNDVQIGLIDNSESPYGSFDRYTRLFPFYRMTDANGRHYRNLSYNNIPIPSGMPYPSVSDIVSQNSPMYDGLYTDSYNQGETNNITYNLGVNWSINDNLRVKGMFSVNSVTNNNQQYTSPLSSMYFNSSNVSDDQSGYTVDNLYKRGRHVMSNSSQTDISGNIMVSYTKKIHKHSIQGVLGGELSENSFVSDSYITQGFLDGIPGYPSNGIQFLPNSRPTGRDDVKRSAGTFLTANYSWDERYMFDLTGRMDGSSNFASKQRTAPFWSVGARWNLYNEAFLKNSKTIQNLALRANIGTTGNQNFSLSQVRTLYRYNTSLYDGYMGAQIINLENPNLRWQVTMNRNIGLEAGLLNGLFNLDLNLYKNTTNDNLTDISIAPSLGFTSYKSNLGKVQNTGVDFTMTVTPIRKENMILSLFINGNHNSNKLLEISSALSEYNQRVIDQQNSDANNYASVGAVKAFLFEEGNSLNTIYGIKSLGIDPATGYEIFVKKNGEKTFVWDAADQVPIGVNEPLMRGFMGVNFVYKNWNLNLNMGYSFGGEQYNYTLAERIESSDYTSNADRRALYNRWGQPGDIADYKAFGLNSKVNPSSRFIEKENYLNLSSARITYNFPSKLLKGVDLSMLKLSLSTSELFYISTIRQERGLSYPYARRFYFSVQLNF